MLAHHPLVTVLIACVALVRTDDPGQLGAALVGDAGHEARDRCSERTAAIGVVRQAGGHEEGTEIRVADAELAVPTSRIANGFCREIREADRHVHRRDDELHCTCEAMGVERVVLLEEREEVQRRQVAGRVVEAHVFRAWVRCIDATGLRVRMPVVDRVVVLNARIGAGPCRLAHRPEEPLGVDGLDDAAVSAGGEAEGLAVLDRAHEQIGHPNRVVRVLVLNR